MCHRRCKTLSPEQSLSIGEALKDLIADLFSLENHEYLATVNLNVATTYPFCQGNPLRVIAEKVLNFLSVNFPRHAKSKATPQDDSKATLSPKIAPDEAWLFFDQEASVLHNKVEKFFILLHL
ncbi:unnamed protein product [Arabidopsis thaliana]|uniref:(thale cress) hypothetical protein n=1 Tax=Arabidopsis thaliana TaxID=3702 RepID=A0A7G2EQW6_ARATH|nr:unnamed protein product [Arabidopsis thaliana]